MKALKVFHRAPNRLPAGYIVGLVPDYAPWGLYSAIPTAHSLRYFEGKKTTPEVGKLMVYLNSQVAEAERFCRTAGLWYAKYGVEKRGRMELWAVECHNLYKIHYLVEVDYLHYDAEGVERDSVLSCFWRCASGGENPLCLTGIQRYAKKARAGIWTTDWVIPLQRLAVWQIAHCGHRAHWMGEEGEAWSVPYWVEPYWIKERRR